MRRYTVLRQLRSRTSGLPRNRFLNRLTFATMTTAPKIVVRNSCGSSIIARPLNFLLFAPIYMLTQGGPAGSTDVLMYEAYKQGFIFGDMGRAMAMVVVIVAILLIVVGLQFRLLSAREQGA